MSQADELLEGLSEDEIEALTKDLETEEHIIIGDDRYITVPEALKRVAVQYDHDIETVIFDCPRFWDGLDMSKMKIYINYLRNDGARGSYIAQNITVDETNSDIMHFTWTISRNVTEIKGKLSFLVCIKKTDEIGNEKNHWNSELNQEMTISEGLECEETVVSPYPDVITQLLTRMDGVEAMATHEAMQEYVDTYFAREEAREELKEYVYQYMIATDPTSAEQMLEYVNTYLERNPPLLVIGPEKPKRRCLWFNTGNQSGTTADDITVVSKMTSDGDYGIYAEVEGVGKTSEYNFDII